MKKIYSTPAMLCVELRTINMMATSEQKFTGFKENAGEGNNGDEIDVKAISDKSLWDNEW